MTAAVVPDPCLVCQAIADTTQGESSLLLAALQTPGFAAAYADSAGVCRRHVAALTTTASTPAGREVTNLLRRVAAPAPPAEKPHG